jgi:hypothetical protein
VPIEQQPGNVEPATQVFAKIMTEEPTVRTAPAVVAEPAAPAVTAVPAQPVAAPAAPTAARGAKSLTRRLARRILGPTLMTKK